MEQESAPAESRNGTEMKRKIIGSVLALVALVSAVLFGSKGYGAQGTGSARPGHKPSCTNRDCPGCVP